jgi:hypothetical protein
MRLRRLLSGAATSALLLTAAAGCGGSAEGIAANLTADDFAAEVAAATRTEQSAHVEATLGFRGETMTMTGDVSTSRRIEGLAARIMVEVPDQGTFELRIVDGVLYLKGDGLSSDPAKPWLELDMTDPSNPLAAFYEQIVANANPAQSARMFEAVTELDNKGEEVVDGVDATHYEVTVDLVKALELSGVADGLGLDGDQVRDQIPDTVMYDVWLETETALMVRLTMQLRGLEMDVHFSDWGTEFSVERPPADQVSEFDL